MPSFTSQNPGQWFYFNESEPEQGGVCLRELSTDEAARIEKLTVKHKRKPVRGMLVDTQMEDSTMATRLTWDYCIVGWSNVQLDDQDLECNTENKVKMMKCTDFAKFIGDCITELVETNKTLEEARAKNLESSSGGKLKSQAVRHVQTSTTKQDESHPVKNAT